MKKIISTCGLDWGGYTRYLFKTTDDKKLSNIRLVIVLDKKTYKILRRIKYNFKDIVESCFIDEYLYFNYYIKDNETSNIESIIESNKDKLDLLEEILGKYDMVDIMDLYNEYIDYEIEDDEGNVKIVIKINSYEKIDITCFKVCIHIREKIMTELGDIKEVYFLADEICI